MARIMAAKLAKARELDPFPPVPRLCEDTIKAIQATLTGEGIIREQKGIKEPFVSQAVDKAEHAINLGRVAKSLAADMKQFIISRNRRIDEGADPALYQVEFDSKRDQLEDAANSAHKASKDAQRFACKKATPV